jgi:hypothetical protein
MIPEIKNQVCRCHPKWFGRMIAAVAIYPAQHSIAVVDAPMQIPGSFAK